MGNNGGGDPGVVQQVINSCTQLVIMTVVFGLILMIVGLLLHDRSPVFLGILVFGIIAILTSILELYSNVTTT